MQFRRNSLILAALVLALSVPSQSFAQHYVQSNLVSDIPGMAPATDANLVNPWGLARSTTSPWWVSDNGTGVSTLYDGTGASRPLIVTVPAPPSGSPPSTPTGVVFNGSPTDFLLAPNTPARFIFATEDGTISGWNSGTAAVLKVDHSAEAVYKGITTGDVRGKRYLYVANFHSGRVEVYDTNFQRVRFSDHDWDHDDDHNPFTKESFEDDFIPGGYAPFNVQNIGGSIFVTYAKQDRTRHDDVAGPGFGFVDIYSPSGRLESRLQHGPWLNSPWGVVWAPRDFGEFSNRVLVGNFGSGQIAAFNGFNGRFIGFMKTYDDPAHLTGEKILSISGLWAIAFGNSATGVTGSTSGSAGPYNSLFFTAGIEDEQHGLFGVLTAVPGEQDGDEE
jgi:uncharacterized protein (TIGR03118 family)